MKLLSIFAFASLLCACSATPVVHNSFNGYSYSSGPTSADDPRLRQPRFYMDDEGDSMPWLKDAPRTNR